MGGTDQEKPPIIALDIRTGEPIEAVRVGGDDVEPPGRRGARRYDGCGAGGACAGRRAAAGKSTRCRAGLAAGDGLCAADARLRRPPLVLAGDWTEQACVEGAVRSGEAAAAFGRA